MNRQEAIRILKKELEITKDIDKRFGDFPEHREALEMAISSLETDEAYQLEYEQPEFCADCISREAVKYYIQAHIQEIITESGIDKNAHTNRVLRALLDGVNTMPSATPQEPKTGHWIPTGYYGYADGNPVWEIWECSECGYEHNGEEDTLTAYCPDCGANMVESQASEGYGITNGEMIQKLFICEVCEPIIEDDIIHVIFADKKDSAIGFDWSWWNTLYAKEQTE